MSTRTWIAVLVVAVGTWASRSALILLLGRVELPERVRRSFRYVAPSVMAALSVPAFLAPGGSPTLSAPHLVAGALALATAWRWRSFVATLAVGLLVYTVVPTIF